MKKIEYHQCLGKLPSGRQCWYQASILIEEKWYCSRHARKYGIKSKFGGRRKFLKKDLTKAKELVERFNNGKLGKNTNYKKLWEDMVPVMLQEIIRLRIKAKEPV